MFEHFFLPCSRRSIVTSSLSDAADIQLKIENFVILNSKFVIFSLQCILVELSICFPMLSSYTKRVKLFQYILWPR